MNADRDAAPDDVAALKAAPAAERAKGTEIAAELAVARAKASEDAPSGQTFPEHLNSGLDNTWGRGHDKCQWLV
ncbi:hypothetical protein XH83_39265 (plasmid) [Bradyrhizobium sp. CCBAU 53351]|nr:hypothetical protein X265_36715 [Bradyrhizobium guangdongense]QAU50735.1 hypothetical protein XH91_35920 [Bradyrhizobium guangzhouense]QOZ49674.1 hypothetical protein XH89_40340 [Bradyrhizobium sp. CCBAU 53340]QOZ56791.1 hypothetical protein XH90_36125 [Bradyrhizobium sp. CCBAU 53338]QOZ81432.1 hypothetical protein XH83_39265 [Bradyrhizobium sp. CCBAU 53351]